MCHHVNGWSCHLTNPSYIFHMLHHATYTPQVSSHGWSWASSTPIHQCGMRLGNWFSPLHLTPHSPFQSHFHSTTRAARLLALLNKAMEVVWSPFLAFNLSIYLYVTTCMILFHVLCWISDFMALLGRIISCCKWFFLGNFMLWKL